MTYDLRLIIMKPTIPKGTRDFSPQEMVKRNYIFDMIRKVYQSYGYQPIETPAMENSETLMGKYGEEGDRLIFRILNSGDFMNAVPPGIADSKRMAKDISEKALRYDLTVPFARYVVQHRNDITFPFKRYQIQPVWRADRPQKGRYREFYQCDADVIGSDSLLNEVELIQIIDEVFTKLGVPVIIKINNRKILQGIAEYIGAPDKMIEIATAIDKLDKIGWEGVEKELEGSGFIKEQINSLKTIIKNGKKLNGFKIDNAKCHKGITELDCILKNSDYLGTGVRHKIQFDPSLARGLNYYTGTIIEVKVNNLIRNSQFTNSICGGGRYDDLTGIFGLPDVSGVGISFGADRIYDVMEELTLFPKDVASSTKVLLTNFGDKEAQYCLKVLRELHTAGISAELYPDAKKLNKQFEYADKRSIPYVVSIGQSEMEKGIVKVKDMISGEQKEISLPDLIASIK